MKAPQSPQLLEILPPRCQISPFRRKLGFFILFGFLIGAYTSVHIASAQIDEAVCYDRQVEATASENFHFAAVQFWIPKDRKVQGILCVVLHPLAKTASRLATPIPWVKLATEKKFALMAISFDQQRQTTDDWCLAERGTGRALFDALDELAVSCGLSELSRVPIAIVGVCAAGQYAYNVAALNPKRIRAFVTIGGGKHDLTKAEIAAKVKAMIVIPNDRESDTISNLRQLYSAGSAKSESWMRTFESINKYDNGFISKAVLNYLRSQLNSLPPSNISHSTPSFQFAPEYIPMSICGERLPILGTVSENNLVVGAVDSDLKEASCKFEVETTQEVDSIIILQKTPQLRTTVEKQASNRWTVTCVVDCKNLPLGPFHLEVPIRFLNDGSRIMFAGIDPNISGIKKGEISSYPLSLNLGDIEAGSSKTVPLQISSRNGSKFSIESVTTDHKWIAAMENVRGDNAIELKISPTSHCPLGVFSGYASVVVRLPSLQTLRVLYFGKLISKSDTAALSLQ